MNIPTIAPVTQFPFTDYPDKQLKLVRAHNIRTEAVDADGSDGASTHSMRRTGLTIMSRACIQEISGHSNLS